MSLSRVLFTRTPHLSDIMQAPDAEEAAAVVIQAHHRYSLLLPFAIETKCCLATDKSFRVIAKIVAGRDRLSLQLYDSHPSAEGSSLETASHRSRLGGVS